MSAAQRHVVYPRVADLRKAYGTAILLVKAALLVFKGAVAAKQIDPIAVHGRHYCKGVLFHISAGEGVAVDRHVQIVKFKGGQPIALENEDV